MDRSRNLRAPVMVMIAVMASACILLLSSGLSRASATTDGQSAGLRVIRAAGRGAPAMSLHDGDSQPAIYEGPVAARRALLENEARPLALAAGDFDEDGVPDVAIGYAGAEGGLLVMRRGNIDSIDPNGPGAQARRQDGTWIDSPFLPEAKVFALSAAPDLLVSGDFDADGHRDVAFAAYGGRVLLWLPGDGHGGFGEPRTLELAGAVTALLAGDVGRPDGLEDIAVALRSAAGPELLLFASPEGAVRGAPLTVPLPADATSLAIGDVDGDPLVDLVAATGLDLTIVRAIQAPAAAIPRPAEARAPVVEVVPLHSGIRAVSLGRFSAGPTSDLALLLEDGGLYVGSLRSAAAAARRGDDPLRSFGPPVPLAVGAGSLVGAKVTTLPGDDLLVLDRDHRRLTVIGAHPSGPDRGPDQLQRTTAPSVETVTSLDIEEEPVAVLPMRLQGGALTDLVVLTSAPGGLSVSLTLAGITTCVTNTNDSGPGSLRQAILDTNASPGLDTICFKIPGTPPFTIKPISPLPSIVSPVIIDGTTQAGYAGTPVVEINGAAAGAGVAGLVIFAGSSTVRALDIDGFGGAGVDIQQGPGDVVVGCYIGTDPSGARAVPNQLGVSVGGVPNCRIGGTVPSDRNVISGNVGAGVLILGGAASGNLVEGNYIGTDATGAADLGNFGSAVVINSAPNNRIGLPDAGAGNVLSGNSASGILIGGSPATGNLVQGNLIGTSASGGSALGNSYRGVWLSGSSSNTIGGTVAGARNIISGNAPQGVLIDGGASANIVTGNYIGTDVAGAVALGNAASGVEIQNSPNNTIGGTTSGSGNVISGNGDAGVLLAGSAAPANLVQGNLIGTDRTGSAALPNADGVRLVGVSAHTIGGTATGAGNLVSGNAGSGVLVDSASSSNQIAGNRIGTDLGGSAALGNLTGISVQGPLNVIGGTAAGAGNVVSGNRTNGVTLSTGTARKNAVQGNLIGTDAGGVARLGNGSHGVLVDTAIGNIVGGSTSGSGNVVSANGGDGVLISGGTASSNLVSGNLIGTDRGGIAALGNRLSGVEISAAPGNTVGGALPGARNVISGNSGAGVTIIGSAATNNQVQGNYIGTDVSGLVGMGNGVSGVIINTGSNNTIGGAAAGSGNVISANQQDGVLVTVAGATGNLLQGNLIGTSAGGTAALPNLSNGVEITAASGNTIGGTVAGAGNVISGNLADGIRVAGTTATNNLIQGNLVGTDRSGMVLLNNALNGVELDNAPGNLVGGTTAGSRNVIAGAPSCCVVPLSGVLIANGGSSGDQVQGNYIGTDVTGGNALGNIVGVTIKDAPNNLVGGATAGAGNLLSGFLVSGSAATGNLIQGNLVGLDATGTRALGTDNVGTIVDAPGNVIGGTVVGARNVMGGVVISGAGASGNKLVGNFVGTDLTGTVHLAGASGVTLDGAPFNSIGTIDVGGGNLITGIMEDLLISGAGARGNLVQGNLIGSDASGTRPLGSQFGVHIDGGVGNTIGGTDPAARNVISGNFFGVGLTGAATGNLIQGNFVGTDAAGTAALPNNAYGFLIASSGNTIGGDAAGAGNVISGNRAGGIFLESGSGNLVQGNRIGTDAAGSAPLGNAAGIALRPSAVGDIIGPNLIGGTTPGTGNRIAFNTGKGIDLFPGTGSGITIRANGIFSNGDLGIDLNDDGVTPNDANDPDTGPNDLQNYPTLAQVRPCGGITSIAGTLNSLPSKTYSLDFYLNSACDPSGFGEGESYLGSLAVTTDATGNATFTVAFPVRIAVGQGITATATDPGGSTSEFSKCLPVPSCPPVEVPDLEWAGDPTTLGWCEVPGATEYHLYRGSPGSLPDLLNSNLDSCLRFSGPVTTTGPTLTENPPLGSMLWYVVRAADGCGEGPAGDATAGPETQNSSGTCP